MLAKRRLHLDRSINFLQMKKRIINDKVIVDFFKADLHVECENQLGLKEHTVDDDYSMAVPTNTTTCSCRTPKEDLYGSGA